ncbi:MAG: X-Pro dipeptidyl-peptidase domain protein [Rhodospirillales bacterium]|nr:X-Pro dipeptidyl-peptidase domain protein [Rhodospirillales bacterium]
MALYAPAGLYDVNPNSREPEGHADHKRIAINRLHLDRDHPSHILLPIVPAGALTPLRPPSAPAGF